MAIRIWTIVWFLCFIAGVVVMRNPHFFDDASSEVPALALAARRYPLSGCVAAVLLAIAIFTVVCHLQPAMVRSFGQQFSAGWTLATYVGCSGIGSGEFVSLFVQLLQSHRIDVFAIQHALFLFLLGLIGLAWGTRSGGTRPV